MFSLCGTQKESKIDQFILEAIRHHPTIKFTAEISGKETNFLDTTIFKGERFHKDSVLDINTHFKWTEKFQYTLKVSIHAPGVKKGFTNGEALRLLRTNSSETKFEENICNFKSHLRVRRYADYLVNKVLAEVKFRAWLHEPSCFGVGWPGCHVIAKLIFVAFNKHAEIPANSNQPG